MTDGTASRRKMIEWADPAVLSRARRSMTGGDFFRGIADGTIPPPPLYKALGIELQEVRDGGSLLGLTPGEEHYNPMSIVHGGVAGSLIDSAAGIAVQSALPEGPRLSTIRLSVDFMRPMTAHTGAITCEGVLAKPGRQIAHADAIVRQGDGKMVARGSGIFAVIQQEAEPFGEPVDSIDPAAFTKEAAWEDPAAILQAGAAGTGGLDLIRQWTGGGLPAPPFSRVVGFGISAAEEGEVTFTCEPTTMHYNPMGSAHGGLAFSLIDSATGVAVASTLPPVHMFTTINTTVEFYRPVTVETGEVSCTGKVVRRGRRIAIADGLLTDGEGREIARGQSTCMIIDLRQG